MQTNVSDLLRSTMTEPRYLFVYGTLLSKLGHSMHQVMKQDARYIGPATYQGRMYLVSGYPGVVASDDAADRVSGEVYELTDPDLAFDMLDVYEGCEASRPEFKRTAVTVQLDDGREIDSWIYMFDQPVEGRERIVSGSFVRFLEHQDRS